MVVFFDKAYEKDLIASYKSVHYSSVILFGCLYCELAIFCFFHRKIFWWTQIMLLIYIPGKKYFIYAGDKILIKV